MDSAKTRVICLVDVDCFEVQVYDKIYPKFKNFPRVVVNRGKFPALNKIVAVDYIAKNCGVTRHMSIQMAKRYCPNLKVIKKDKRWGKSDTATPRHASWKIFDEVRSFCDKFKEGRVTLEFKSMDEFYLDFTREVDYRLQNKEQYPVTPLPNFHLEGGTHKFKGNSILYRLYEVYPSSPKKYEAERRLIYGGMIAQDLCEHISETVGFQISAGISTNKLLAKLACPVHKPGGVTVLPRVGLDRINWRIKIADIPGLGGKLGSKIKETFNAVTMRDLSHLTRKNLEEIFDPENACRFFDLGQGISDDVVIHKIMNEEISCGKGSIGHATGKRLMHFLENLAKEMAERLQEEHRRNRRTTNDLQIQCIYWKRDAGVFSKTFDISKRPTWKEIAEKGFEILSNVSRTHNFAIKMLKLTAKNFNQG